MLSRKQESLAWSLSCTGFSETWSSQSTGLRVPQHTLQPVLTNMWHDTYTKVHPAASMWALCCRDRTACPSVPCAWAVPSLGQLPSPCHSQRAASMVPELGKASALALELNMALAGLSCISH